MAGATPPSVVPGLYEETPAGRARNLEALKESDNAFFGLVQELAEPWAERAGLGYFTFTTRSVNQRMPFSAVWIR